ncbi:hypothetical protein AQUSIP_12520 [Aquicella siphonis]|uniref:Uncharacterized protein n=1 Tax=Aquicella siphonis TaxID=254247 RepID=A0A5E4PI00_9COXI|nr:hypothetical protein [Aquicella siphonis]VVC75951.1 hypothetical protein AQUSIP_12520 [Aquicella siphonis]
MRTHKNLVKKFIFITLFAFSIAAHAANNFDALSCTGKSNDKQYTVIISFTDWKLTVSNDTFKIADIFPENERIVGVYTDSFINRDGILVNNSFFYSKKDESYYLAQYNIAKQKTISKIKLICHGE